MEGQIAAIVQPLQQFSEGVFAQLPQSQQEKISAAAVAATKIAATDGGNPDII